MFAILDRSVLRIRYQICCDLVKAHVRSLSQPNDLKGKVCFKLSSKLKLKLTRHNVNQEKIFPGF